MSVISGPVHPQAGLLAGAGATGRTQVAVDHEELRLTGASRVEDLFGFMPGAAAPARFGVITGPNLRGDVAELFFNGQRRGDNLFGIPPSLVTLERVELVAGGPLLRTGPGKRTGGALNWVTRAPSPLRNAGELAIRTGSWLPQGGSYLTLQFSLDTNWAISPAQAMRVIAAIQEDDTFYAANGGRDDQKEMLWSWAGSTGGGVDWSLHAHFHTVDRPQTLGVNRPWQGLIHEGHYFTGELDTTAPDPSAPFNPLAPGVADPGLLRGGVEDTVRIDRDRVLLSIGDRGTGEAFLVQGMLAKSIGAGTQLLQAVLVESVKREKLHGFYYAEAVEQLTIDSVSRLVGKHALHGRDFNWEIGLHLRLESRDNRTNYWNEFAYAFDLSQQRTFDAYAAFAGYIAPGAVTDPSGRTWYLPSAFFSTPESTDSKLLQTGSYGRVAFAITSVWSIQAGIRADRFDARSQEPLDLVGATGWRDRVALWRYSGDLVLVADWQRGSISVSYSRLSGLAGNTVGDGLNLYAPGVIHTQDLRNESRLFEIGASWQVNAHSQVRVALFDQQRTRREFFGPMDLDAKGAGLQFEATIAGQIRVWLNGQYLDMRTRNASPAEFGGGSLWNVYAPGEGPTGEGNGIGFIGGFFLNSLPPGDYRLPGVSRWQASWGIRHQLSERLLAQLWASWHSQQWGNLAREWHIPAQIEWNLSLTYQRPSWDLQLLVRNFFAADNWRHNGDTFFNQMLVSRDLPMRVEARWRLLF